MDLITRIVSTHRDIALAVVRVTLGIVFFVHGAQKVLGWFGGHGFGATMGMFTGPMGIPAPFAFLAICAEFFGGLGLIAGLLGRIAAFGIACNMIVAIFKVHLANGFFMNWQGNQPGEGFEYHLLVLGMALAVMIAGSGACSLDHTIISRKLERPAPLMRPSH